jgi:hypothetical protein
MILPYLHERRVYLNRKKDNTNYFYTSIDTSRSLEAKFNEHIKLMVRENQTKNNFEFQEFLKNINLEQDVIEKDGSMSIICMNLTETKYYVYDTNGILKNRVNYQDISKEFGNPVSVSSNGQFFIF